MPISVFVFFLFSNLTNTFKYVRTLTSQAFLLSLYLLLLLLLLCAHLASVLDSMSYSLFRSIFVLCYLFLLIIFITSIGNYHNCFVLFSPHRLQFPRYRRNILEHANIYLEHVVKYLYRIRFVFVVWYVLLLLL